MIIFKLLILITSVKITSHCCFSNEILKQHFYSLQQQLITIFSAFFTVQLTLFKALGLLQRYWMSIDTILQVQDTSKKMVKLGMAAQIRRLQISSLFPFLLSDTFTCGQVVHFHYFITRFAAFQAIIYQATAIKNNLLAI